MSKQSQPRPDARFNLSRRGHFDNGVFESHPGVAETGRTVVGLKLVDQVPNEAGGHDYVPLFSRSRSNPDAYRPGSEMVARDRTDLAENPQVGEKRSSRAGFHFIATGIRNDATGEMEEHFPVNVKHLTNSSGELMNAKKQPRAILHVEAPEHVVELQNKQNSKWALAGKVNIGKPFRPSETAPLVAQAKAAKKAGT